GWSSGMGAIPPQTETAPGDGRWPSARKRSHTPSSSSTGRTSGERTSPPRPGAAPAGRSRTATERPAAARVMAKALPAGPPPTTTASWRSIRRPLPVGQEPFRLDEHLPAVGPLRRHDHAQLVPVVDHVGEAFDLASPALQGG